MASIDITGMIGSQQVNRTPMKENGVDSNNDLRTNGMHNGIVDGTVNSSENTNGFIVNNTYANKHVGYKEIKVTKQNGQLSNGYHSGYSVEHTEPGVTNKGTNGLSLAEKIARRKAGEIVEDDKIKMNPSKKKGRLLRKAKLADSVINSMKENIAKGDDIDERDAQTRIRGEIEQHKLNRSVNTTSPQPSTSNSFASTSRQVHHSFTPSPTPSEKLQSYQKMYKEIEDRKELRRRVRSKRNKGKSGLSLAEKLVKMKAGETIEEKVPTEAPIDPVVKLKELYKELNEICKQEYKLSQDFIRTIKGVRGRPLVTPSPKLSQEGTTTVDSNHSDDETQEHPHENNIPKESTEVVVHDVANDNPTVTDDRTTYSDPVKSSDNITDAEVTNSVAETVHRNDSREDNKPPVLPHPVTDNSHIHNSNYDPIKNNRPDTNSMLLSDKFPTTANTSTNQCDQTEDVTAEHEESKEEKLKTSVDDSKGQGADAEITFSQASLFCENKTISEEPNEVVEDRIITEVNIVANSETNEHLLSRRITTDSAEEPISNNNNSEMKYEESMSSNSYSNDIEANYASGLNIDNTDERDQILTHATDCESEMRTNVSESAISQHETVDIGDDDIKSTKSLKDEIPFEDSESESENNESENNESENNESENNESENDNGGSRKSSVSEKSSTREINDDWTMDNGDILVSVENKQKSKRVAVKNRTLSSKRRHSKSRKSKKRQNPKTDSWQAYITDSTKQKENHQPAHLKVMKPKTPKTGQNSRGRRQSKPNAEIRKSLSLANSAYTHSGFTLKAEHVAKTRTTHQKKIQSDNSHIPENDDNTPPKYQSSNVNNCTHGSHIGSDYSLKNENDNTPLVNIIQNEDEQKSDLPDPSSDIVSTEGNDDSTDGTHSNSTNIFIENKVEIFSLQLTLNAISEERNEELKRYQRTGQERKDGTKKKRDSKIPKTKRDSFNEMFKHEQFGVKRQSEANKQYFSGLRSKRNTKNDKRGGRDRYREINDGLDEETMKYDYLRKGAGLRYVLKSDRMSRKKEFTSQYSGNSTFFGQAQGADDDGGDAPSMKNEFLPTIPPYGNNLVATRHYSQINKDGRPLLSEFDKFGHNNKKNNVTGSDGTNTILMSPSEKSGRPNSKQRTKSTGSSVSASTAKFYKERSSESSNKDAHYWYIDINISNDDDRLDRYRQAVIGWKKKTMHGATYESPYEAEAELYRQHKVNLISEKRHTPRDFQKNSNGKAKLPDISPAPFWFSIKTAKATYLNKACQKLFSRRAYDNKFLLRHEKHSATQIQFLDDTEAMTADSIPRQKHHDSSKDENARPVHNDNVQFDNRAKSRREMNAENVDDFKHLNSFLYDNSSVLEHTIKHSDKDIKRFMHLELKNQKQGGHYDDKKEVFKGKLYNKLKFNRM